VERVDDDRAPVLSVVLATRHAWPTLRETLRSVEQPAADIGAEVVVVDGDGSALPAEPEPGSGVLWLRARGRDIFELRALGAAHARGAIIALTEDHCLVAPDWCDRMLRAHDAHPDAAVVAGCVLNGATQRAIDRANFLLVHGVSLPPLRSEPTRHWSPTPTNMSFKREVVPRPAAPSGFLELVLVARLLAEGKVAVDHRIVVHHDQSNGFVGTFVDHFHAGRSVAGLFGAVSTSPAKRRILARATLGYPRTIVERVRDIARDKPAAAPEVRRALPLAVGLAASAWAGVATGAVAGPGSSPRRMK
jgi:hypothetical protein